MNRNREVPLDQVLTQLHVFAAVVAGDAAPYLAEDYIVPWDGQEEEKKTCLGMWIGKKMVAVTKTEYEVSGTAAAEDDDTGTAGRETRRFHIGITTNNFQDMAAGSGDCVVGMQLQRPRLPTARERGQGMDRQSVTWKHRCRSENSNRQHR